MKVKETAVLIYCPKCLNTCNAKILHTWPFLTFIHECEHCKYIIMESEWDEIGARAPIGLS